ncbi:MAG: hypothetical protein KDM81_15050 [Verrucomicrobiae bacterium]|nr:hypothetical protein [Verrucomicrobiae bacterium]
MLRKWWRQFNLCLCNDCITYNHPHMVFVPDMGARESADFCTLESGAKSQLEMAVTELNFSARAYDRILKVSCTTPC